MKIIHFCSYYLGSKVYFNLFDALKKINVINTVFIPVRERVEDSDLKSGYCFVYCLGRLTRLFYFYKLLRINKAASKRLVSSSNSGCLVHAHTLYADGIPAFIFSKRRGAKLIIAIRNTDVNLGFKYYRHYKWLARRALDYSSQIIFISPAHKLKFQNYFGHCYDDKLFIVPNGIDDFYIDTAKQYKVWEGKKVALHIAAIDKNKNLKNTILAYFIATKEHKEAEFRVAGGTYSEYQNVFGDLPEDLKEKVIFLGKLDKVKLVEHMRQSSVFIMVSHKETFGLVYIEAISQCLPIVYTCGQGVDGYFDNGQYGFKADSRSVESISMAIRDTLNKFPNGLGPFEHNPAIDFSWDKIAKVYKEVVYK